MVNSPDFAAFYSKVCQYDRHIGLTLTVHEPGKITYSLQVDERHVSFHPACHGGVIAGMMDATLGVTALSWAIARQQLCATVEFKTHFFAPVKVGDRQGNRIKISHLAPQQVGEVVSAPARFQSLVFDP